MPSSDDLLDPDLDAQLRGLFQEAEEAIEHKGDSAAKPSSQIREDLKDVTVVPAPNPVVPAPSPVAGSSAHSPVVAGATPTDASRGAIDPTLIHLLKPLVMGLDAISKATTDNTTAIKKLEAAYASHEQEGQERPGLISDLRGLLETKNTVSQGMFSALHDELKGYKDDFLLQSIHRPIIRDIVTVYDDVAEVRRQVERIAGLPVVQSPESPDVQDLSRKIAQVEVNLFNNLEFLLEVLNRLDVAIVPQKTGKLDKHTQRAVLVEEAESEEEDGTVVRAVKPGFLWRGSILRPEDVVIKKWKKAPIAASKQAGQ